MRRRKCLSEEKLPQSHLPLCSSSPSASHPHRTESSIGAAHPCGCRVEVSTKYNRDLYSWMLHHHFFFRPFQLLLAPLRLNESDMIGIWFSKPQVSVANHQETLLIVPSVDSENSYGQHCCGLCQSVNQSQDMTKVSCAINLILQGSGCIFFSVLSSEYLKDQLRFHCLACGTWHFCC